MSHDEQVSATLVAELPIATVFAVLADPGSHAGIDGTGWVADVVDTAPLSGVGQLFRMAMYHEQHPDGAYQTVNQVAVFEAPRAIGWLSGVEKEHGELDLGGWIWRYDLRELGPTTTEVTHTYDWSGVPRHIHDRGITFPPFAPGHLENSLRHLVEIAAARVA